MLSVGEKLYPYSDGEPMTDKDINRLLMEYVELSLSNRYERDPQVYVSANLFIYYKKGEPNKCVAPDVFLVRGVDKHIRDHYLLWKEGKVPQVAFEFVARRTRQLDANQKKDIYEDLGIEEYYVFDPKSKSKRKPRFRAFRLVDGQYEEQDARNGISSPALGLDIQVDGQLLRLHDPITGYTYPLPLEAYRESQQAKARAASLESEVRRLERLLEERKER